MHAAGGDAADGAGAAADAADQAHVLGTLPLGVWEVFISEQLAAHELGAVRAADQQLLRRVNGSVTCVHTHGAPLSAVAALCGRLPNLRCLGLGTRRGPCAAAYRNYAQLAADLPLLAQQLAAHVSLHSLHVSTATAAGLGQLLWAHQESEACCGIMRQRSRRRRSSSSSSSSSSASSGGASSSGGHVPQLPPSPRSQVLLIPDELAAAPGVRHLELRPASASGFSPCGSAPAVVWLNPGAWAGQLVSLVIEGVPLLCEQDGLQLPLGALSNLRSLALRRCCLTPSAVPHLLAACGQLRLDSLLLPHNELYRLPSGPVWGCLSGLKELDLSHCGLEALPHSLCSSLGGLTALRLHHNQLAELPAGLAAARGLRLLDTSHCWLSGARGTLGALLQAWRQLAVLRLENTSDKRGALALPPDLGAVCPGLRELGLGANYALHWDSVAAALPGCKALEELSLPKAVPPAVSSALAARQPGLAVRWC